MSIFNCEDVTILQFSSSFISLIIKNTLNKIIIFRFIS